MYNRIILDKLAELVGVINARTLVQPVCIKPFDRKYHKDEVIQELKYHIKENQYSDLFLDQLTDLHGCQYVKIDKRYFSYSLKSIYATLEKIIDNKLQYKEFNHPQSLLLNKKLYHVHHNKSYYNIQNHIRYFKHKYKDEKLLNRRILEIFESNPDIDPIAQIAIETLTESFDYDKRTGEWIVFQYKNNTFYFVSLSLHTENDKKDMFLFNQIEKYIREDF